MVNNIFILDLETNTININESFTNPENTEILDRYVHEYNFNATISDGLIKNKYPITTGHITGINEITNGDKDLSIFKGEIKNLLKYCKNPILLGHNAIRFDFPILQYHKVINYQKFNLHDSMDILPILVIKQDKKPINKKLITLYNFVFEKEFIQEHRAKSDVMLIVELFKKFNVKAGDLI
jgi:hypothetical protein